MESGNCWYVDITDEFIHGLGRELRRGIDINDNPNLNRFNNGLIGIEPLNPPQDFVIGDEYVEAPEFQLDEFPLDEQIHYGFIMPGLEQQHEHEPEHMEDDDEDPDPRAVMLHVRDQEQRPVAAGGRTRRRKSKGKSKSKVKSKVKSKAKSKSKKTVKMRKCNRRRSAHK
jgi:hypothetical protein